MIVSVQSSGLTIKFNFLDCPFTSVTFGSSKYIYVAGEITFNVYDVVKPLSLLTEMVVFPTEFAVTFPVLSTVATELFEEVQFVSLI